MKIEGRLVPPRQGHELWAVRIPLIEVFTQGRSKSECYLMAKDAVESLVHKRGFKAVVTPRAGNAFTVSSPDQETFVAFVLARLRVHRPVTTREIAKRLGSSSPNTYGRYEQGRATPRLDTFEKLLEAIDPALELILRTPQK